MTQTTRAQANTIRNKDLEKRKGSFLIPSQTLHEHPAYCAKAMKGMCVLEALQLTSMRSVLFVALSYDFDEMENEKDSPPSYTLYLDNEGERLLVELTSGTDAFGSGDSLRTMDDIEEVTQKEKE